MTPQRTLSPSETPSPEPSPTLLQPLPRTRLTSPNYLLTSPNSHRLRTKEPRFRLTEAEYRLLQEQAREWANKHLPTAGVSHRPPAIGAYVGWLLRERQALLGRPRAVFGRRLERKVRYVRAVARWDRGPHGYNGPAKAGPSRLCLRRSLLAQFPKEGDSLLRHRGLEAAGLRVVAASEGGEVLDPLCLSVADVSKLDWWTLAAAQERFSA